MSRSSDMKKSIWRVFTLFTSNSLNISSLGVKLSFFWLCSLGIFSIYVGCEILMSLTVNNAVSWVVTPCDQVEAHRHLRGMQDLHLQGQRVK
jgi:hypothetical protein